jgi:hypothetical protein
MRDYSAGDTAEKVPFGINLAMGAAAMMGAALIAAVLFSGGEVSARLAVVAIAVGGYAVTVADIGATLATATLGYLLFTGFLMNRYGELSWGGASSGWHVLVLTLAATLSLGSRWIRTTRAERARVKELDEILGNTGAREKEPHGS